MNKYRQFFIGQNLSYNRGNSRQICITFIYFVKEREKTLFMLTITQHKNRITYVQLAWQSVKNERNYIACYPRKKLNHHGQIRRSFSIIGMVKRALYILDLKGHL